MTVAGHDCEYSRALDRVPDWAKASTAFSAAGRLLLDLAVTAASKAHSCKAQGTCPTCQSRVLICADY